MENEVDRITNQCILERLLQAYQLLHAPELARDLPEYGCALSYQFEHLCLERQLASLRDLNVVCARLFARNLAQLIDHSAGFWSQLQRHAERVALCIERVAHSEALLTDARVPALPVALILNTLLQLLRAQPRTPMTPVLRRLVNLHRLLFTQQQQEKRRLD
jgi:hypothetical protein